jgi:hypothetical protein
MVDVVEPDTETITNPENVAKPDDILDIINGKGIKHQLIKKYQKAWDTVINKKVSESDKKSLLNLLAMVESANGGFKHDKEYPPASKKNELIYTTYALYYIYQPFADLQDDVQSGFFKSVLNIAQTFMFKNPNEKYELELSKPNETLEQEIMEGIRYFLREGHR